MNNKTRPIDPPAFAAGAAADGLREALDALLCELQAGGGLETDPTIDAILALIQQPAVKVKAIREALEPGPIPDGMVMVPRDPTLEMKQAAYDLANKTHPAQKAKAAAWDMTQGYRAMLSAAPTEGDE